MIRETLSTFTTDEKSIPELETMISTRSGAFFVAIDEDQTAGFATFGPFRSGPGYAHTAEHTVIVARTYHGQGIGRKLLGAAEKAAQTSGHHVMVAGISHTNLAAQDFHQKLGYAQVGRLPQVGFKFGQWLDLVLMQKIF